MTREQEIDTDADTESEAAQRRNGDAAAEAEPGAEGVAAADDSAPTGDDAATSDDPQGSDDPGERHGESGGDPNDAVGEAPASGSVNSAGSYPGAARDSAAVPASPPPVPAPAPAEPAANRGLAAASGVVGWLALLLAIASLWLFMDGQREAARLFLDEERGKAELLQRLQALESVSGQDTTTFDQMRDNLQRQIELEVEDLQARQQRFAEDQLRAGERLEGVAQDAAANTGRALGGRIDEIDARLAQLLDAQRAQSQRIAQLGIADRDSWLLAEAQYLLRLASQRLIMTGDTLSAEALMNSADAILRELNDVDLYRLRGALAADLVAVRAVPRLDLEGLYLRVDALIRQTDELVMYAMPEIEAPEPLAEDAPWQERLAYGYESAVAKLSEYIVVSRRDTPIETLMDPQYEGLVRQNMRMLLEQAQVALLSGNQQLFERSLQRAGGWVEEFFKEDEAAALAMRGELTALAGEQVSVELPNLNESLEAMDEVVRLRLERDRD